MSSIKHCVLAAGLVFVAVIVLPRQAVGQRSAVEIWSANCGRCHTIQPPNRYSTENWASVVTHMTITARMTGAESEAVRSFLYSGARTVGQDVSAADLERATSSYLTKVVAVVQTTDSETVWDTNCVPCHGSGGKGDGPAAVAFDPKPADMTAPDFWSERTDEQIDSIIANGKGVMPPLVTLDAQGRRDLITFLRARFKGGPLQRTTRGFNP